MGGLVWIREDFRLDNNYALAYASENHESVIAFYIYNPKNFIRKREAQQWWTYKSLENYKIKLELLIGDELEIFSKIRSGVTIYWNKIYEPDVISLGKKIRDMLIKNKVEYKYFKGNILNEFQNVTKNDGTPFKVFTPFWRVAEKIYINSVPSKITRLKKNKKKINYFKKEYNLKEILPKK